MWAAEVRIISTHNGIENLFQYPDHRKPEQASGKATPFTASILKPPVMKGLYKRICQVKKERGVERRASANGWQNCCQTVLPKKTPGRNTTASPRAAAVPISAVAYARQACRVEGPVLRFTSSADFNSASESEPQRRRCREWLEARSLPELMKPGSRSSPRPWARLACSRDLTGVRPDPGAAGYPPPGALPTVEPKNTTSAAGAGALISICDRLPRRDGIHRCLRPVSTLPSRPPIATAKRGGAGNASVGFNKCRTCRAQGGLEDDRAGAA